MSDPVEAYYVAILDVWNKLRKDKIPGSEWMPYLGQAWSSKETHPHNGVMKVLFVGINPSFDQKILANYWDDAVPQPWKGERKFLSAIKWNHGRCADEHVMKFDHHSRNKHKFYKLIERFAKDAELETGDWHHLDLLPLRVNEQAKLKPHLDKAQIPKSLEELIKQTIGLMSAWEPKVVVVLNALASRLLIKMLGLKLQPNGHRYQTEMYKGLCGTTFLLGSQLSGGATSTPASVRLLADLRDLLRGGNGLNGGDEPTLTVSPSNATKRAQTKRPASPRR